MNTNDERSTLRTLAIEGIRAGVILQKLRTMSEALAVHDENYVDLKHAIDDVADDLADVQTRIRGELAGTPT